MHKSYHRKTVFLKRFFSRLRDILSYLRDLLLKKINQRSAITPTNGE